MGLVVVAVILFVLAFVSLKMGGGEGCLMGVVFLGLTLLLAGIVSCCSDLYYAQF